MSDKPTMREYATERAKSMRCNCDLDNWEPTPATGHSHVCRIHTAAVVDWAAGKPLNRGYGRL
jgi:hypothetical protein